MKRHRATTKGGRNRAFKTDAQFRNYVRQQVNAGKGNNPDGSWHACDLAKSACRDASRGVTG